MMYYKNHTYEAHLRISFWHLFMNFEKSKKTEFRKNEKINKKQTSKQKYWRYHHSTHLYQKPQSGAFPEIWSDKIFLSFRAIFCPLPPPKHHRKPKFWKNGKSIWRCHYFKLVQQKTQSNDVCLFRYGEWQI